MKKGFTLLELILYTAILTVVMASIIPFLLSITKVRTKTNTEREVFEQSRLIAERIKYEIRNASGINTVTATNVSLASAIPANNPTVINCTGGKIQIKLGAGSYQDLNSLDTVVSNCTFTNNSDVALKTKNISFSFDLSSNYGSNSQEYVETTSIKSSAEIRSN